MKFVRSDEARAAGVVSSRWLFAVGVCVALGSACGDDGSGGTGGTGASAGAPSTGGAGGADTGGADTGGSSTGGTGGVGGEGAAGAQGGAGGAGGSGGTGGAGPVVEPPHEVWVVDQSNSVADGGGKIYVYDGVALGDGTAVTPEVVDLGLAARDLCVAATGTPPVRPHMLLFNADHSRAILSFVATGHVVFFDAETREPVECIDVGVQAHAAYPLPDDTGVIVANQNGKLLQRIDADFVTDAYTLDNTATLDLAAGTTPSGAAIQDPELRPDNAPICPIVSAGGDLGFVTLRGGGLFVVDVTATPLAIVAEYDRSVIGANGCGGLEAAGRIYINSGGGTTATPYENKVYSFELADFQGAAPLEPNTPEATLLFARTGEVDSHGATLVGDGSFAWFADRASNRVDVVDTATNADLGSFDITGVLSADPAPDLLDASPLGTTVYAALRGLKPLTANNPNVNNAVGDSPGVGVLRVLDDGATGEFVRVESITNVDGEGVENADPHGLRVRILPN